VSQKTLRNSEKRKKGRGKRGERWEGVGAGRGKGNMGGKNEGG